MARGRKQSLRNVVPMRADERRAAAARERIVDQLIESWRPKGLSDELASEFDRVARLLADPTVDRFKARYVDAIVEYCIAIVRLRTLRAQLPTVQHEIYRVKSRNGDQAKTHPYVAQINETWRQWRSMCAQLGLSPADERSLIPGQGDLFDEAEKYF